MVLILTFLIALVFSIASENSVIAKNKEKYGVCSLFVLWLASAFRYYNIDGFDYNIYEGWYANVPKLFEIKSDTLVRFSYEAGYFYLMSFFKTLGVTFYGFCVITSAFFYCCIWKGFKRYTVHYGLLTMFFAYKLLFYDTHISMRQPITIAGFFLIIPYLENRKWVKYFIGAFLLSRFHNGAYLLFPLYFITYLNLNKFTFKWLYIIFTPTIILGFVGVDVVGPIGQFIQANADSEFTASKAAKYFDSDSTSSINIIYTLEFFLFSYFIYRRFDVIFKHGKNKEFILKIFVCLLPLFTLFRMSEIMTREKDYFILSYAILLGYVIDSLNSKGLRKSMIFFIFSLCIYGYFRLLFGFNGDMLYREYRLWPFVDGCSFFDF
ncbi:EpsG family protein [Parabacteroides merdae]|uniref:EpsG family protein n=1 Tax=Parabacteroides merdae TaxID=46503 RepID=UPI0039B6E041